MPYPRTPLLPMGTADGPAVTTPASLTDATPLPANEIPAHLLQVGGKLYTTVVGRFTSTATPGTLTIGLYLAKPAVAIASAVLLVASSALIPFASQTNKTIKLEFETEVISIGAGGAGVGQVRAVGFVIGLTSAASPMDLIPLTAPMAAVSIDTTSSQRLLLGLTPSVTTGSVTIHTMDTEYSGN